LFADRDRTSEIKKRNIVITPAYRLTAVLLAALLTLGFSTADAQKGGPKKGAPTSTTTTTSTTGNSGTAAPATIYDVKQGAVSGGVAISHVIVTACAQARGYFVQHKDGDPTYKGPEFSGIYVDAPTVNCATLAPGTRLDLTTATASNYLGQIQLKNVAAVVTSTAEPLPTPAVLTAAQAGGSTPNSYEGVLVRVDDVDVTEVNPPPGPGDSGPTNEFVVGGTLRINDLIYLTSPLPAVGAKFASITGVLDYRNNNQKLEPRSAADIVR
jgi:hypothetical protein